MHRRLLWRYILPRYEIVNGFAVHFSDLVKEYVNAVKE
jgi:hypothetical protein